MEEKKQLLEELANAVLDMRETEITGISNTYLEKGYDALEGITDGLAVGMNKAGELYEQEEYYVPELLLCSDALYAGIDVLRPHVRRSEDATTQKMVAVVGVVEGDTHDIGKNLVKIMLETVGFEVYDLGRDVPTDEFIRKAKEVNADFIALSTLMTTTLINMRIVIEKLKEEGMKDHIVVMVGGGPVSPEFAHKIGADAYEPDASSVARRAKELVLAKKAAV